MRDRLVRWVARVPGPVQAKLPPAFVAIVVLLIVVGAVDLRVLSEVNRHGAEMVARVEVSHVAYHTALWVVIGFAVGSIGLALVPGYATSWSLIGPALRMDAQSRQIVSGDFSQHVAVPNRDELGTQASNLNRMTDELSRLYHQLEVANRHKSEFLASMSHEFRTPLNTIIGFSEDLIERPFAEFSDKHDKQEKDLRNILHSGRHLLSLINDIRELSKVEAGRIELELERFSPPEENALTMVRERASRYSIALSLDVDPIIDVIEADEGKITVVFYDLQGFTAFAETAEREEVIGVLREFHTAMGEIIHHCEGTLDRFLRDGMMIFSMIPSRTPTPQSAPFIWQSQCTLTLVS
jgi:signal transduction histidine kinase